MHHTFPHLVAFVLADNSWQDEDLVEFMKRNGHLHTLMMFETKILSFSSKMFKSIANELKTLNRLYVSGKVYDQRTAAANMLHLAKLKSLKALALNFKSIPIKPLIDELVKENIPIEEFGIKNGSIDRELLIKMSEIKSLKSLALDHVKMDNVSLIDVAKQLPMLEELSIEMSKVRVCDIVAMLPFATNLQKLQLGPVASDVLIDIADYRSILNIINCRMNGIMLSINFISEKPQVLVPRNLLQQGHHCLKIENDVEEGLMNSDNSNTDSDSDTDMHPVRNFWDYGEDDSDSESDNE